MTHPIRSAAVHTFSREDGNDGGHAWLARFYPYSVYPVFFHGETEADVIAQAEALRAEAIEKHEAACIARQEAAEKRKATLAAKKPQKETNA